MPPVFVIAAQLLLAAVFVLVKMIYVEDVLNRRVEVKGESEARAKT